MQPQVIVYLTNPTNYSEVKLDSPFSSHYCYDLVHLKTVDVVLLCLLCTCLYIVKDLTKKLIVYACLKLLAYFKAAQLLLLN